VVGLAAHGPAGVQRRQHDLVAQALQDGRDASRQVVVEQDGTGVEAVQAEPVGGADERFEEQALAVGQVDVCRLVDFRQQGADPDSQAGLLEDGGNLRDVLQVELVARVVFRDEQQAAGFRTELLDGAHRCLHAERQEGRVQVIEAAGKQVGIDRCQLEAGIAQVARCVEGWRVFLPLAAQPVFDLRTGREEAAFQFEERPGQGGGEVRNHGLFLSRRSVGWPQILHRSAMDRVTDGRWYGSRPACGRPPRCRLAQRNPSRRRLAWRQVLEKR